MILFISQKKTETMKILKKRDFLPKWTKHASLSGKESFRLWFGINLTKQDINEAKSLCEKTY